MKLPFYYNSINKNKIPDIALDKDKILPLAIRYLKDGRIKNPFLLRYYLLYFPETNNPKIYYSAIQTKPNNFHPLNKTPSTNDNNYEENDNKESISDLLNSFKPYYSMNIERNTILFHILLFENDTSSIKEVSIKEINNNYYIYIKGYKNQYPSDNEHVYNIKYGNFYIETEIPKSELTLENKKFEISKDNNGYIIVTIN